MGNICKHEQHTTYSVEGTKNASFSQIDESLHIATNGAEQTRLRGEIARLTRVNIENDEKISELRKEIEKQKTESTQANILCGEHNFELPISDSDQVPGRKLDKWAGVKDSNNTEHTILQEQNEMLKSEIERVKSEMDKQILEQRINEEAFKELTHKLEQAIVERDEQISNHRKVEDELNTLKSELIHVTTKLDQKTYELDKAEENLSHLFDQFEQVITERNTLTIEKLKYEVENTKLKNQLHISDIQKERLKNDLQELHTARDALQKNFNAKTKEEVKLRTALNDAQKATQELLKQLQKSDSEKEKLKLNLKELQKGRDASQLKNEPNNDAKPKNDTTYLVTQSDGNRPDTCQVAEKFGELYVNEWADCYEVLKSEESVCQTLLAICVNIYSTYVKAVESDYHEKNALITAEMELDNDFKGFIKVLRGGKTYNAICLYWNKCKDICRQMIANDPPIYMDIDTDKHGHRFNDTLYQYYTVRGPRIDYIVWPALYRGQNDKMLCKGHAQGAN